MAKQENREKPQKVSTVAAPVAPNNAESPSNIVRHKNSEEIKPISVTAKPVSMLGLQGEKGQSLTSRSEEWGSQQEKRRVDEESNLQLPMTQSEQVPTVSTEQYILPTVPNVVSVPSQPKPVVSSVEPILPLPVVPSSTDRSSDTSSPAPIHPSTPMPAAVAPPQVNPEIDRLNAKYNDFDDEPHDDIIPITEL
jgi:hypothetical protein